MVRSGRTAKKIIISCEHAGNQVPAGYRRLFEGRSRLLASHRGFDPGAVDVARQIAAVLGGPLYQCKTTRLLVDVNRTLSQDTLFSVVTRQLSDADKNRIVERIYAPYFSKVEGSIRLALRSKRAHVLHLSLHSFTPIFQGHRRKTDIGILFDPKDPHASSDARDLQKHLKMCFDSWTIDLNEPYSGATGGISKAIEETLMGSLRRRYHALYVEVNQKHLKRRSKAQAVSTAISEWLKN